jgi:hypothetical protein
LAGRHSKVTESIQPSIKTPDRQAEAFPVLTPAQIDRIRPFGTARTVRAGEIVFEPGQLGMPCSVVLSGKLEILMTRLSGEHVFVTYGRGGFSAEMVLISGARSLSRGRVAEAGEFLEVSADALHSLAKGVLRNPTTQKLAECLGFPAIRKTGSRKSQNQGAEGSGRDNRLHVPDDLASASQYGCRTYMASKRDQENWQEDQLMIFLTTESDCAAVMPLARKTETRRAW